MSHHTVTDIVEIDNLFIPLSDGRRLAARLWMPIDVHEQRAQAAAVLEYIPYRKRDGTAPRDESTYPSFARAGLVGVRVDIAGHGESDGEHTDEYSPAELSDGVEVISWIAAQAWCTGAVGMMGISWGGFNSLQIAALAPNALKAVISLGSTVDRYNDDIHYKNGCHLSSNLTWSSNMLCYAGRAPDPALVGDRWRHLWLNRLKTQPLPISTWLKHQRRDTFWEHGSVCENYAAIKTPTLIISGWADGYINAPPAAAANFHGPTKAINGPWIHKYPHFAWPKPRMDFVTEAIHWWQRWLNDVPNNAESLPAYRAYISEAVRPAPYRRHEPGSWVAMSQWPSDQVCEQRLFLTPGGDLTDSSTCKSTAGNAALSICSPQDCGTSGGEFFTLKPTGELPGDQRNDDAGSLTFDTPILTKPLTLLGRPKTNLTVRIDQTLGNIAARLIDVHPDGTGHRVSYGVLNLAHRNGNATPCVMTPGRDVNVTVVLNECGYRFLPGHRLRLSISTAYWPMVLPPPYVTTAIITTGQHCFIDLPVLQSTGPYDMPEPADENPLPTYTQHSAEVSQRRVEHDLQTQVTHYHVLEDTGDYEMPSHGLVTGERREDCYSIARNDPLSLELQCSYNHRTGRDGWRIAVNTQSSLTCDESNYYLKARVQAFDGDELINDRSWDESIKRDHM